MNRVRAGPSPRRPPSTRLEVSTAHFYVFDREWTKETFRRRRLPLRLPTEMNTIIGGVDLVQETRARGKAERSRSPRNKTHWTEGFLAERNRRGTDERTGQNDDKNKDILNLRTPSTRVKVSSGWGL